MSARYSPIKLVFDATRNVHNVWREETVDLPLNTRYVLFVAEFGMPLYSDVALDYVFLETGQEDEGDYD